MRLRGKTAIITGAGDGLGKGFAERFAREGAKLVLNDIRENAVKSIAEEINSHGGEAVFIVGDTSKEKTAIDLIAAAEDNFDQVNILINNAGIETIKPMHETSKDEWDKILGVNLTGCYLLAKQAALKLLSQGTGGSIINISSAAGLIGFPMLGAYCASKHGIIGLTKAMALELRAYNVRVNAICPAFINTSMVERGLKVYQDADIPIVEAIEALQGRLGDIDEVTGAAVYLASDEASFVSGIALPVDNGAVAG